MAINDFCPKLSSISIINFINSCALQFPTLKEAKIAAEKLREMRQNRSSVVPVYKPIYQKIYEFDLFFKPLLD